MVSKPHSIHICNLANVAYGYSKILKELDHPLHLRCHDLLHLMSQPEWDDLELKAEDFPDEYNFYENSADFGDYQRPDWYLSDSVFPGLSAVKPTSENDSAKLETKSVKASFNSTSSLLRQRLALTAKRAWLSSPERVRRIAKPPLKRGLYYYRRINNLFHKAHKTSDYQQFCNEYYQRVDALVTESKRYGPEWALSAPVLAAYQPHAWWLAQHLGNAEIAFSYVLAPIYSMILGRIPYVSVEIGTMREIPFENTDRAKALALAYRKSNHIIITNPDVVIQAKQLGLENYSFCPHPLDESIYFGDRVNDEFRFQLLKQYKVDHLLFAPARQNWRLKGNDSYFKAFARYLEQGHSAALIIPGWGQEVDRSKELCDSLGIAKHVKWISPQSESMLVKYYRAADFVLDQFTLGVFGLTSPKAMSCGSVVLTSYDPSFHNWCFPEHPPLVSCNNEEDIFNALTTLSKDDSKRADISQKSRKWVIQYHSKAVISKRLEEIMQLAQIDFNIKLSSN